MTDKQIMTQENGVARQLENALPIGRYTPAVDIYENEEELVILAEMPGVVEQGLQIEIDRQILTLEGELRGAAGEAKAIYHRQFKLPEAFAGEAGEAALKDGILRLRLPKTEAAKPKKIAVKTLH